MNTKVNDALKSYGLVIGKIFSDWLFLDVTCNKYDQNLTNSGPRINLQIITENIEHNEPPKKCKKYVLKLVFEKINGQYEDLFIEIVNIISQKIIHKKYLYSFELPKYGDVIIDNSAIIFSLILCITKKSKKTD